ncbi:MAG: enoyl-CoA hydratase/isomerase family protein [Deltaproteobacteria bacterium]|nr:enoyl-CoA hydratase/isomerase family protein [Deltaproteobacteria bacterium]
MTELKSQEEPTVVVKRNDCMVSMILNRPRVLNSLNVEMIRLIDKILDEAEADKHCQFILLYGSGERGFCAGGDIKALAQAVKDKRTALAEQILKEEYDLCLRLHRFAKPIIVLADGITMGAGLGLAAAADLVVATEKTRMAMPETRIGFFPDVGATGWMFSKCPAGYPEYLGLTGYEMIGAEAVRVGFASHLVKSERLPELVTALERYSGNLSQSRSEGAKTLLSQVDHLFDQNIPNNPATDQWVAAYFAGKNSMIEIMESLRQCTIQTQLCDGVFTRLAERSPTAVVLTLKLLRCNEMQPLEEVFQADFKAARFILRHPDYIEGVRARVVDKDDDPKWQPSAIEEVGDLEIDL